MHKVKVIIVLIGLLFLACSQRSQQVNDIVEKTRQEFCPDKRLNMFNIEAKQKNNKIVLSGETNLPQARDSLIFRLGRESQRSVRDKIEILPSDKLRSKTCGIIILSTAHQRRRANVTAEMINQAIMGQGVRLYKEKGLYYLAQLDDDGYMGWIMKGSVYEMNESDYKDWQKKPKAVFTDRFGWVYSQKNRDAEPVCDLVWGALLTVEERHGKWLRVIFPDGRNGFVPEHQTCDYGKFQDRPMADPAALVKSAKQCLGIPYLWGGRSIKGFDCSGFMQTLFKMHGINLPRDANMQVKLGKEIKVDSELAQAQTGDLFFFGPSKDRITHVGLYIGEKKMIHSDGYVKINSFDSNDQEYDKDRISRLVYIKRIVNP
ncbi:hypothetical protein GF407_15090 [candidate division KSB1 bacterium]|nr:hypothetical protein [candidate division KSB1 bacterium]